MNRLTEIYNQIMTGLKEQGEPSIIKDEDGPAYCFYRLEKNGKMLKCAAGQIITDDKYDPKMENISFIGVNEKFNLGFSNEESYLISTLQRMHDNLATSNNPNDYENFIAVECLRKSQAMIDVSRATITELPF